MSSPLSLRKPETRIHRPIPGQSAGARGCACSAESLPFPTGVIMVLWVAGEVDLATLPILREALESVVAHLEKARRGAPDELYITFSSAVGLTAHGYSKKINPRLNDYLAESPPGRIGIIATDYFEEPRELVYNVIKANVPTDSTSAPGQ